MYKRQLKTGDSAPNFSLKGIDDKMHSLESYAGSKGLLIIFMCNHCPYVKAKIEAIKEIHEKYGEKPTIKLPDQSKLELPGRASIPLPNPPIECQ